VAAKAAEAAARAATLNADAKNAQSYAHAGQQEAGGAALLAKATMASISALPEVRRHAVCIIRGGKLHALCS